MTYFAYLFCVITILSFLWFGKTWLFRINRWHIGCMSLSYTSAITLIATFIPTMNEWQTFWFLVTMMTGLSGLTYYWAKEVSHGRQL